MKTKKPLVIVLISAIAVVQVAIWCSCAGLSGTMGLFALPLPTVGPNAAHNGGYVGVVSTPTQLVNHSPTNTTAPIATPLPTATPSPTLTPQPTATTQPETPEQAAMDWIRRTMANNGLQLRNATASWDGSILTITADSDITVHFNQEWTFYAMRAMWTRWASVYHPASVEVDMTGQVSDPYGNSSIGNYTSAILTADTAAKFNWGGLDEISAWEVYDYTYIVKGFS